MVCIYCGRSTAVANSRISKRVNGVWRRRRCQVCQSVFTTHELVDWSNSFTVLDTKTNQLQPFSRDKLFISLYKSCCHRSSAVSDASSLVETAIKQLTTNGEPARALLTKTDIYTITQVILDRFDQAAASFYKAYHQN
jgi:transcriptional regulator NrdR family protein